MQSAGQVCLLNVFSDGGVFKKQQNKAKQSNDLSIIKKSEWKKLCVNFTAGSYICEFIRNRADLLSPLSHK